MLRYLSAIAWALFAGTASAQVFYVATNGNDTNGDGSLGSPWATLRHATNNVADGATILVRPGNYIGRSRVDGVFTQGITVASEIPYQARLLGDNGAALICFTCSGITVEGFDIAHLPANTGAVVVQIQDLLGQVSGSDNGTDAVVSRVTLRNNIIHDSTNNDLLKVNNGAEAITVEGNLFYDQAGSDEHIDINSVIGVTVQDNIFMNVDPQTETSAFVVIKDSNGAEDTVVGAQDVMVRRNMFLNYQGSTGHGFLRLGEDSTATFEADGVLIENNLMLGNSGTRMRAALTVQGSNDVVFRHNTITGDLPSLTFAARLIALGPNPSNAGLTFFNNIWSDPTGTMGSEQNIGVDLFEAPASQNAAIASDNNAYYNGGSAIPTDAGQAVTVNADDNRVVGDLQLPSLASITLPVWNGVNFDDGSATIREAFTTLAARGLPAGASLVVDQARPDQSPAEDLLGRPRGNAPDIGALETNPKDVIFANGFERPL